MLPTSFPNWIVLNVTSISVHVLLRLRFVLILEDFDISDNRILFVSDVSLLCDDLLYIVDVAIRGFLLNIFGILKFIPSIQTKQKIEKIYNRMVTINSNYSFVY